MNWRRCWRAKARHWVALAIGSTARHTCGDRDATSSDDGDGRMGNSSRGTRKVVVATTYRPPRKPDRRHSVSQPTAPTAAHQRSPEPKEAISSYQRWLQSPTSDRSNHVRCGLEHAPVFPQAALVMESSTSKNEGGFALPKRGGHCILVVGCLLSEQLGRRHRDVNTAQQVQ
jgi:hypothetical protein